MNALRQLGRFWSSRIPNTQLGAAGIPAPRQNHPARTSVGRWALVLGGVALVAAGCGSSSKSTSRTTVPAGGSSTTLSESQLLAEANQEGSFTYYTEFDPTTIGTLVADFNKVYPQIKVNYLILTSQEIPTRIITEQRAGEYNADLVDDTSVYGDELITAGALDPYTVPTEAPLPNGIRLPSGYEGVMLANVEGIAYNPTAVAAAHLAPPTSLQDFTQPQWRGKFSIDTGALELYQSLIAAMGHTAALNLVKALGNNDPSLVQSHSQALTQVEAGSPIATATAYGADGSSAQQKTPSQLTFVMLNPAPTSVALMDIVKNAPHLAAAKVFIDWYESQAGQQAMVTATGNISLRSDANDNPTIWNPQKWTPALASVSVTQDQYNSLLTEFHAALHVPS